VFAYLAFIMPINNSPLRLPTISQHLQHSIWPVSNCAASFWIFNIYCHWFNIYSVPRLHSWTGHIHTITRWLTRGAFCSTQLDSNDESHQFYMRVCVATVPAWADVTLRVAATQVGLMVKLARVLAFLYRYLYPVSNTLLNISICCLYLTRNAYLTPLRGTQPAGSPGAHSV
jgi:hypothetical protein